MSRCSMPTAGTARRTTTSYAVLGLLSVRSWTTYELAKQVQRSLKWFWPRAERKLYDEPKALVVDGLATAQQEFTGQRPRTVYAITDEGRAALRAWLGEPPAPPATEFEGMLKVFFADAGSLEQLEATLTSVEATAAERLRELAGMAEQALADGAPYPERRHISAVALRLQVEQEAAVLRGARRARDQVRTWRTATDPGEWDDRRALAEIVDDVRALV
jgi:PadR family transcriptional regulator, regulatory protein AphA